MEAGHLSLFFPRFWEKLEQTVNLWIPRKKQSGEATLKWLVSQGQLKEKKEFLKSPCLQFHVAQAVRSRAREHQKHPVQRV